MGLHDHSSAPWWRRIPYLISQQKHQTATLAAVCAVFFLAALAVLPHTPEIQPDSIGYLQFAPDRTAGYPMFLALIGLVDARLSILPLVQLSIFCASLLFFSIAVNRITHCFVCSLATIALIFGNYEVVKYCSRAMTETLFISLSMMALGCLAFWISTGRLRWMVAASALVGAAVAVRPAGYALFVMFPILYLWAWGRERRYVQVLAAMIVPAAIMLFMSLAAYHQRHQTWDPPSVLGYNLLGKAISFADGTERGTRPDLIVAAAKMAALYRQRFEVGENWSDHVFLAAGTYDDIRRNFSVAFDTGFGAGAAADRAVTRLALDIIDAHKIAYLRNVAENYAGLWYVPELTTANDVARLRRQIAGLAQPMSTSIEYTLVARPWPLIMSIRLFQLLVFASSMAFLIALPVQLIRYRRADPLLWFGFAVASALHASIVIVAAINESKPRLMLDSWPLMILVIVLALNWVRTQNRSEGRQVNKREAV